MKNYIYKANDIELAKSIESQLRIKGYIPRTIWVSTLRKKSIQDELKLILSNEDVKAIVTTTSFSTVTEEEAILGNQIWDSLRIPIFQLLASTSSRENWEKSSLGLNPIDLSLQIVMPEIDGRITTRPVAFKTIMAVSYTHLTLPTILLV